MYVSKYSLAKILRFFYLSSIFLIFFDSGILEGEVEKG